MPLAQVISFFFFTLTISVNKFLSFSVKKCWFLRGKSEYLFEQTCNFASMEANADFLDMIAVIPKVRWGSSWTAVTKCQWCSLAYLRDG